MKTSLLRFLHAGDHIVIKCIFVSDSITWIKAEACILSVACYNLHILPTALFVLCNCWLQGSKVYCF